MSQVKQSSKSTLQGKPFLDGTSFIPHDSLENLKCVKCNKYLSIFPIHWNPNGDAICGRCTVDTSSNFYRCLIFENAVECQRFPCAYQNNGCLELQLPKMLIEHENKCVLKKYECPLKMQENCSWQGALSELLDHFEDRHPIFLLKECKFEIDFVNAHKENCLTPYCEEIFVVSREGNPTDQTFTILLTHLGDDAAIDGYIYELLLESGNKSHNMLLKGVFGEKLVLKYSDIKEQLNEPMNIIASIVLKEASGTSETSNKSPHDNLDFEQLKIVECPVCFEYMLPPIYQCIIGHSICKKCKEHQQQCPTCKAEFTKTQNFSLENMILNSLIYPCKHDGCAFQSKARDITKHQATCDFGPFICPLKEYENCSAVFPLHQLYGHVNGKHPESILETNIVSLPFADACEEDICEGYIIKRKNRLFRLRFRYNHESRMCFWCVQLIGSAEESENYNFDIEIFDANNNWKNKRLYAKNSCFPLEANDSELGLENSVSFLSDQVSPFVNSHNSCLMYRVIVSDKL